MFKLDDKSMRSVMIGAAIAAAGYVLAFIMRHVGELNLNPDQAALLSAICAVLVNYIRKLNSPTDPVEPTPPTPAVT